MFNFAYDHIRTADDLRHVANEAGSHFFSPGAMRAFNSRLLSGVLPLGTTKTAPGNAFLFVTSERYDDEPRHYRVRLMTLHKDEDTGRVSVDITTVRGLHISAQRAHKAAQGAANAILAWGDAHEHENLSEATLYLDSDNICECCGVDFPMSA